MQQLADELRKVVPMVNADEQTSLMNCVRWLDGVSRDLSLQTQWALQAGKWRYKLDFMMHVVLMCASASANKLSEVLFDAVRAVLPPAIAQGFIQTSLAEGRMSIPSAPSVSRHRLTLHLSFMLELRRLNEDLLADSDGLPARYHTADSSPQGGREWFLSGAVVVPAGRLVPAFGAAAALCAHKEDSPEGQQAVAVLEASLQRRPCCPVSTGSARASVYHKMHAQLHSLRIEHNTWGQVASTIKSTVSWLTDFGTEAGLASVPQFHV
jgi:hypothetical protein